MTIAFYFCLVGFRFHFSRRVTILNLGIIRITVMPGCLTNAYFRLASAVAGVVNSKPVMSRRERRKRR
jgi:hypothetical protein